MKLHKLLGKHLGMIMVAFALVFFTSACGTDEPETAVVVEEEADLVEEAEIVGEAEVETDTDIIAEADVEAEADVAVDEVEAVATEVTVDTSVVVDTDVITEVEVITEVQAAEIDVETTVLTETDVTVDRASDVETDVTVETEDVSTGGVAAIILVVDTAGVTYLGDPVEQRPFFASQQEGLVVHEDFEPIETSEEIIYDEGLDRNLFGELEQDGITQLTYNNYPLYRYVGADDADWNIVADELGLFEVTETGELGEFAQ